MNGGSAMAHVVLDAVTAKQFGAHCGLVEVRDEAGKVIGWFTPSANTSALPAHLLPQISQEEIERRSREKGGRTLAEIMADLEKRK
jgi:hypothetical protein